MTNQTDLTACPFCGTDDIEGPYPTRMRPPTYYIVSCGNPSCQAEVSDESSEGAKRRWNTRADQGGEAVSSGARETLVNALRASKGWMKGYAEAFIDDYSRQPRATAVEDATDAFDWLRKECLEWLSTVAVDGSVVGIAQKRMSASFDAALSAQRGSQTD